MPVVSKNPPAHPMPFGGAVSIGTNLISYYGGGYPVQATNPGTIIKIYTPPAQVAGLVPMFNCSGVDCREGKYTADSIPNDANFMIPVFGQLGVSKNNYNSDTNTFWFQCPGNYDGIVNGDYSIEKLVGGVYVKQATLNTNTYGTTFKTSGPCSVNYSGYTIDWAKVLNAFGTGVYRFSQTGTVSVVTTYTQSQGWIQINSVLANGNLGISLNLGGYIMTQTYAVTAGENHITAMQNWVIAINAYQAANVSPIQINAVYNSTLGRIDLFGLQGQNVGFGILGGNFINVNSPLKLTGGASQTGLPIQTYCAKSAPFCLENFDCYAADRTTKFQTTLSSGVIGQVNKSNAGQTWLLCCVDAQGNTSPLVMNDSIRIEGFFGYEKTDYERKSIKYQTGVVNKIRDEAILKFTWKAGLLPFWFHERFKVYGLMADTLLASDYNVNNSDYNLKNYGVQADSSYEPDYKGSSRYEKVNVEFKAATQNLKRSRCC